MVAALMLTELENSPQPKRLLALTLN